ncbi:MAG TPA: GH1 family beta-glucosidase [Pseudonocardiaceae bacterium]|jgi:beta-glucosidase|nr:GH1 family beta-glucosidase [Pseudonocardiaceae bacterium]
MPEHTHQAGAVSFPDGFIWGSSTAAYQIEGAVAEDGRTPSIWDTFSHTPGKVAHDDTGDIACDHYHRADDDLDLVRDLGFRTYRFSVAWPRIKPELNGPTNPIGLDFYDRIVDGLLARGIDPVVTLYHWDLPQYLQDKGGWASRDTVEHFGEFVDAVVERLGDRVPRWITLNEPYCSSYISHWEGRHAPGIRDEATAVATVHQLLLGHARAVEILRARTSGKVGITLNLSDPHPASERAEDRAAAARVDLIENRIFLDPLFGRGYPADAATHYAGVTDFSFVHDGDLRRIAAPLDFLGVNYYEQHIVTADPDDPDRGFRKLPPTPPVTAGRVGVRPDGLFNILTRVHRDWTAGLPLWITENGLALHDYVTPDGHCHDPERIEYFDGHFRAAHRAIEAGVPLEAFIVWSLMDNFEWAEGYRLRFGLVHVDYATQTRTPKSSAAWLAQVIERNGLTTT